ncbi:OmpP1/FadL family transporter [Pseudooceanicola sp. HF7]|uniref:OmpP1/FadL family transporter n=1 Tax=Pseudooceanicola sp. HF7 TaxID=2721560 RepID=UPI00142F8B00|nr:outer membrane protein transport protein [Pseudooceanicola sp. HF7]NIZ08872.1 transporter [Pseudooceanicola sp. HF7]
MKRVAVIAAGLGVGAGLAAAPALAGGIERTTQSAMVLYERGNKLSFSFGTVNPTVSGTTYAVGPFAAQGTGNVSDRFNLPAMSLKMDINDQLSFALIYDEPFGASVYYDASNAVLGATAAESNTKAVTALAKYQFDKNLSAFGGLRIQRSGGMTHLGGAAYGPLDGYDVTFGDDVGYGYVLGAAYEIPEMAMRVALTYNSAIDHSYDTVENINPGATTQTESKTPSSWNLEFQTGVAPGTLLMGSIRYVKHSQFKLYPQTFTALANRSLVNLEDTTTYRLGVGRQLNDQLSGSVMVTYEPEGDPLVSPLAPRTGMKGITFGLAYKASDQVEISGGVSYMMLGDATPATSGTARADFSDNSYTAVGMKVSYSF